MFYSLQKSEGNTPTMLCTILYPFETSSTPHAHTTLMRLCTHVVSGSAATLFAVRNKLWATFACTFDVRINGTHAHSRCTFGNYCYYAYYKLAKVAVHGSFQRERGRHRNRIRNAFGRVRGERIDLLLVARSADETRTTRVRSHRVCRNTWAKHTIE